MGYTHYFPRKRDITDVEWKRITDATREVIALALEARIDLAYEYDEPNRAPEVTDQMIFFNGVGDEGHETFVVNRYDDMSFNFCKTAEKPYDVAVTAVLTIMHHYAPGGWRINSDGGPEDWFVGMEMAHKAILEAERKNGLHPEVLFPCDYYKEED